MKYWILITNKTLLPVSFVYRENMNVNASTVKENDAKARSPQTYQYLQMVFKLCSLEFVIVSAKLLYLIRTTTELPVVKLPELSWNF